MRLEKFLVGAIVVPLILMGFAVISPYGKSVNMQVSKGFTYWSGTIYVDIYNLTCDPNGDWGDGLTPAPDIYYIVSVNDQRQTSPEWSNTYEVTDPWTAQFSITTRDKFVWIEIEVFDRDPANLDDYIIDIDPSPGYALDLVFSLETGTWAGDTTEGHAIGDLPQNWAEIYFNIRMDPSPNPPQTINPANLNINYKGLYLLGMDDSNIYFRVQDFYPSLEISNPTSSAGTLFVHLANLDPDFITFGDYDSYASRGVYSATLALDISAHSTINIYPHPWYQSDDFWFFAMGDNRPGSGVSMFGVEDGPYSPSREYRTFAYYFTDVVNPIWGVNDGDLVAGYGGGLIIDDTDYNGLPSYDIQFRTLYMLTGLSGSFFFACEGNHDPPRYSWMPRHSSEYIFKEYFGDLYYSFNYSNTHVLILDSYEDKAWSDGTNWWEWNGNPTYGGYIYGEQLQWIKRDLQASSSYTHKIAVFHHPIENKPDGDHGDNSEFFNETNAVELVNTFLQYGVDYIIVGHVHNYSFYYTYINGSSVSSSYSPQPNSIPTLMTGGGGAHNAVDWIVPDIEGSYHFCLVHVTPNGYQHYLYKYEDITDSNGNPLTTIEFLGSNDGSINDLRAIIHNQASKSFPYIRLKFYMQSGYSYAAYSNTTQSYEKIYQKDFGDYTVVYVETNVSAYQDKEIRVFVPQLSGVMEGQYDITTDKPYVELMHNFTYTGNVPADITITADSSAGWATRIYYPNGTPLSTVHMNPGDKVTFIVNVTVGQGSSDIVVAAYYSSTLLDSTVDKITSTVNEITYILIVLIATVAMILIFIGISGKRGEG